MSFPFIRGNDQLVGSIKGRQLHQYKKSGEEPSVNISACQSIHFQKPQDRNEMNIIIVVMWCWSKVPRSWNMSAATRPASFPVNRPPDRDIAHTRRRSIYLDECRRCGRGRPDEPWLSAPGKQHRSAGRSLCLPEVVEVQKSVFARNTPATSSEPSWWTSGE